MLSSVQFKIWLFGTLLILGCGFLFLRPVRAAGEFCLCKWDKIASKSDETIDSVGKNSACVGLKKSASGKIELVDEGNNFSYLNPFVYDNYKTKEHKTVSLLTDVLSNDLEDLNCSSFAGLSTKFKAYDISVTGLSCETYENHDTCVDGVIKYRESMLPSGKMCFCTSADGISYAGCKAVGDDKSCQKYIGKNELGGEYTTCTLMTEKECTSGVAKAVEAEARGGLPVASQFNLGDMTKSLNKLGTSDLKIIIGRAIQTAMGVIGSIALVMFIYGGILLMTARGESEHYDKATSILVWSSLGVVVIFASYALLKFVFDVFV